MVVELGRDLGLDPNDALAALMTRRYGIKRILSFDRDFDHVEGVEGHLVYELIEGLRALMKESSYTPFNASFLLEDFLY